MPPEDNADAIARGDVVPEAAAEIEAAAAVETKAADDAKLAADQAAIDADAEAAKTDDKTGDDDDAAPKGNMIPQTRFNEAVGKERGRAEMAEAELNKYRQRDAQQQQAENFEESQAKVKEMLTQHSKLLADGDLDKASEVMGDVLQLRDDMQNARMDRQSDNARNSAKVEVQYDSTVERLEAEYPEINPDSDDFDQVAVRQVQMMVTGIMQSEGKNPAEALLEATNILLKPAKDAAGLRAKPSEEVVEAGLRRTQQQIDKNIKAADAQPPATGEVGADHDKTGGALDAEAVAKLSWDEFIKVPDEELAKMRGDYIN
jgi:hypothetical protein